MKKLLLILIPAIVLVSGMISCLDYNFRYRSPVRDKAYVPVYGYDSTLRQVGISGPSPIDKAGKIYVFGNYLFQVDNGRGIHILNYENPSHPRKIAFLRVPGCREIAIRGPVVYTNNMNDLVSIDLSDPDHPNLTNRIIGAFPDYFDDLVFPLPPEKGTYFVCPSPGAGDVIGWELQENVSGADCFNN